MYYRLQASQGVYGRRTRAADVSGAASGSGTEAHLRGLLLRMDHRLEVWFLFNSEVLEHAGCVTSTVSFFVW